jgi:predicted extracellular nuclease
MIKPRPSLLSLGVLLGTSAIVGAASAQSSSEIVTIPSIQGAGHISPLVGETVTTIGVVTAVDGNGFYFQDAQGDGDDDTADGLFVFTNQTPIVSVGDEISLTGRVSEFIPGGASTGNLSTTQMTAFNNAGITILGSNSDLPTPVIIGRGGRVPPAIDVISPDETDPPINLQDVPGNPFDPEEDGIDFYESLEGMLVTIDNPVAVSATRTFNAFSSELFTLPNNFVEPRSARTQRGGILLQPDPDNRGDQNPERVQVQFDGDIFPGPVPAITVGDRLSDVTGVMGYSFGNFEVNAVDIFEVTASGLDEEKTRLLGQSNQVTVASYNVLNLSPDASDANQRLTVARHIADNMGGPDIVALQEIQDNSGEIDDGVTDATETLEALVAAIAAAGGPNYAFFDVAPADGASGGVPGGNIRNAFLYNPERVSLIEFESLTESVLADIGVSNPAAFAGTRDPLKAVFTFNGAELLVINNHLTSRFGSTPVFGGPQPFVQAGEGEREAQVGALNEVVDEVLALDENANIVVLGDINTFQFTNDLLDILPGDDNVLTNLVPPVGTTRGLDRNNIYTFNFEGNSQVLDHVFVTEGLANGAQLDIVHVNVDFPRVDDTVGSDHEPLVAQFRLVPERGGNGESKTSFRRSDL